MCVCPVCLGQVFVYVNIFSENLASVCSDLAAVSGLVLVAAVVRCTALP